MILHTQRPSLMCHMFSWVIISLASTTHVFADDSEPSTPAVEETEAEPEPLTPEAQQVADELVASLPADSEARAMLDSILDGSRLGRGEGWFKLAVAQNRFGWEYAVATFDVDGDGSISQEEFTGPEDDFSRLDRDGNDSVTAEDFDWSQD